MVDGKIEKKEAQENDEEDETKAKNTCKNNDRDLDKNKLGDEEGKTQKKINKNNKTTREGY